MKDCELCKLPARMFCESDQASLCWKCDQKVHGANFLVAKHARTLLCQSCQAPTPWSAAGPNLCPTISFCEKCLGNGRKERNEEAEEEQEIQRVEEGEVEAEEDEDEDLYEDDEFYEDDDEEEEYSSDEENGENQVVPFSSSSPPHASSSSSEDLCNCGGFEEESKFDMRFKRMRENDDLVYEDDLSSQSARLNFDLPSSSSKVVTENEDAPFGFSLPSKYQRREALLYSDLPSTTPSWKSHLIASIKKQQQDRLSGNLLSSSIYKDQMS